MLNAQMGSLYSKLCSKSSAYEGGHTVIGSNTVGGPGTGNADRPANPGLAALEAAESRLKMVEGFSQIMKSSTFYKSYFQAKDRGTRGGNLARKLEEQHRRGPKDAPQEPERLVVGNAGPIMSPMS